MAKKNIQDVFEGRKLTWNGDDAFDTVGDKYADVLFMSSFFSKNLHLLSKMGFGEKDKLFAMMLRDPRFGLGCRALGREMLKLTYATPQEIVKCGRYDDLIYNYTRDLGQTEFASYIIEKAKEGDALAKKWLPRFGSSKKTIASAIAKNYGMSKQEYNKLVKVDTTEKFLTERDLDKINFSHVPSLASLKYYKRFRQDDLRERHNKWLLDVKEGNAKVNTSVTNCYDIYKQCCNDENFDADVFFDNIEKIHISCLPIIDTSGSMQNTFDAMGKAISIGHYLATCSTYLPGKALSFSSHPEFLDINSCAGRSDYANRYLNSYVKASRNHSNYAKQCSNLFTGDVANTDFRAVMELMKQVDIFPEYIIVLSDMEFDSGSAQSTKELEEIWEKNGCKTKLIWWNLNGSDRITPEKQANGNIFMSGYSPMLLKYLESGFDNTTFINKLLKEYEKRINNI